MAEPTLSVTMTELRRRVARRAGFNLTYASMSSGEQSAVNDAIVTGQRWFYFPQKVSDRKPHLWSFMRPTASITVWPTSTSTLDSAPVAGTSTVTVDDPIFYDSMVGETVVIAGAGGGSYTIASVTSSTVCIVIGDASGGADAAATTVTIDGVVSSSTLDGAPVSDTSTYSTVTVDDAILYDSMVGKTLTVTGGGTYTIFAVTSTTVCVVYGDASGEADEAVVTVTADGAYNLPIDFGGLVGSLTYSSATTHSSVQIVSETRIRERWQSLPSLTDQPSLCAVRPKAHDRSKSQRFELLLSPIPDAAYTFNYRFNVLPDALVASTHEYPYGGEQYGEALVAACIAAFELAEEGQRGPDYQQFLVDLDAAIARDRRISAPDTLGYNGDSSDALVVNPAMWPTQPATYGGVYGS